MRPDRTLFVQPFPPTGARYQVSATNGGHHPVWSRDGRELWWEAGPGQLVAASVTMRPTFAFAVPVPSPAGRFASVEPGSLRDRDIMPDGRWLTPVRADSSPGASSGIPAREIRVVVNWFDELKQKLPVK